MLQPTFEMHTVPGACLLYAPGAVWGETIWYGPGQSVEAKISKKLPVLSTLKTPPLHLCFFLFWQCYTHKFLGWKINIVDKDAGASMVVVSKMVFIVFLALAVILWIVIWSAVDLVCMCWEWQLYN